DRGDAGLADSLLELDPEVCEVLGDDPRGARLLERELRMPAQVDVQRLEVDRHADEPSRAALPGAECTTCRRAHGLKASRSRAVDARSCTRARFVWVAGRPRSASGWVREARGRASHDELERQLTGLVRRGRLALRLERLEDRLCRPLPLAERELVDRREAEELAELVPVDSDDRQVLG